MQNSGKTKNMAPLVSILICTRNRPDDITHCLPTVLACAPPKTGSLEIIVVDQSTDDKTGTVVRSLQGTHPNLVYVPTATVGKSLALNIGLARARGELIIFTDDDCTVPPTWVQQYVDAAEQDPSLDVFFGPVHPAPELAGRSDISVPSWHFTSRRTLLPGEIAGMGANMALRRKALERLVPEASTVAERGTDILPVYDSLLGPGAPFPAAEEGDMVYRLRRAGARVGLEPTIIVWHYAYRTHARWHQVMGDYGRGDAAFWGKHARCGDPAALWNIVSRLAHMSARMVANTACRRPTWTGDYVRGFMRGLAESRRYDVDRRHRLYVHKPI
jgi:glycosyltransferase involved in cell wall biosynthesis